MSDSVTIFLEVYLALSLIVFLSFGYIIYKYDKKNKELTEDVKDISYWFLDHNFDIKNGFIILLV